MFKTLVHHLLNRPLEANKYDFGHILVIGGAPGMRGAPVLSALAALRSGAGLVTIAAPESQVSTIAQFSPEIMTLPLPETSDKTISPKAVYFVEKYIKRHHVSFIVLGPGLSQNKQTQIFARQIIQSIDLPMLIDADGLNALARHLSLLSRTKSNKILTPHIGEFSRIIGEPVETVVKNRELLAIRFAKEFNTILALKGHQTIVVNHNGRVYRNKIGNPGLATAGSGDVLSGIIAAFYCQKLDAMEASELGVYLHGLAGDLAVKLKTQPRLIAEDIIEHIPVALTRVKDQTQK